MSLPTPDEAEGRRRVRRLKSFIRTTLIALLAIQVPFVSMAVMTTNGGAPAQRLTSTSGLSPSELVACNLQGKFRSFLGTPISSAHFITAKHVGISLSDTITFDQGPNQGTYSILDWTDDPEADLRIVEIDGTFNAWAQLWGAPTEPSGIATLFGRGAAPNGTVVVNSQLKGWRAAAPDGLISWGRNVVNGTLGLDLIYASFDTTGLTTEASLTTGDSGGAWFMTDTSGTIRLAAISYGSTGPYQFDAGGVPDGNSFHAALFDIGGLWIASGAPTFVPDNPVNIPAVAVGTRISTRISWINSAISVTASDSDLDGIDDEFDNCPLTPNPSQSDTGGLGSTTPDGIGNACQCGDVTTDGVVDSFDAEWIKRQGLGLAAPLFLEPDNCDVTGEGDCNGIDAILIRHAAVGTVNPAFGQNCPNAIGSGW